MIRGDTKESNVAIPVLIMDAAYRSRFPFIKFHRYFKLFKLYHRFQKNYAKKPQIEILICGFGIQRQEEIQKPQAAVYLWPVQDNTEALKA